MRGATLGSWRCPCWERRGHPPAPCARPTLSISATRTDFPSPARDLLGREDQKSCDECLRRARVHISVRPCVLARCVHVLLLASSDSVLLFINSNDFFCIFAYS